HKLATLTHRRPAGYERDETRSDEDDHTDNNEYYFHRVTGPCQDIDANAESVSERLRSERPGRGDPKQSDSQCFAQARSVKQRQPGDDKGKEEYRLTSKVQIGKGHYSILSVSLCVSGRGFPRTTDRARFVLRPRCGPARLGFP